MINLLLETIEIGKQAIVFVNSKRSAEKEAEDLAKKLPIKEEELGEKIRKVLSSPTKQCERLSFCVKHGVAFHHSGLNTKQREIIEDNFREGKIKIICATPTLAAGVDLPAFRSVIRDAKRFTQRGMQYIPVLEYLQMAGRAGRPSFDTKGEAILIAKSDKEKEELEERYIRGVPEKIYSKLAAEPVMRTYVLSLIATERVKGMEELKEFFSKTFFGHQYGDEREIERLIGKVVYELQEWEFLTGDVFSEEYEATKLGKRVSELYLDPYTANKLIQGLKEEKSVFQELVLFSDTLEMRPLINVKRKEEEEYYVLADEEEIELGYEMDLRPLKTAKVFDDWINEKNEEKLMEDYDVRPGELKAKLDTLDWLMFCGQELSKILMIKNELHRLRIRVKNGIKDELLPLIIIKGIGRVRSRKLFNAGIKNVRDLREKRILLLELLGEKIGNEVLKQLSYN